MSTETYDEFRARLMARHERPLTALLSSVGDTVIVGCMAFGIVRRDVRLLVGGPLAGLAIAAVAHHLQPGTLRDELTAIGTRPLWAARAEFERVFSGPARQVPRRSDRQLSRSATPT